MKIRPFSMPLIVLFAAALLALTVPPGRAAESQTDAKIRLMSEALRARDAVDLAGAQKAIDQLAAVSPNDPAVKRLKSEIAAQVAAVTQQRAAEQAAADRAVAEAARRAAAPEPVAAATPNRAPADTR